VAGKVYRSSTYQRPIEHLTDAVIGATVGAVVAVLVWLGEVWLRFH
jgi:hypothetical protein